MHDIILFNQSVNFITAVDMVELRQYTGLLIVVFQCKRYTTAMDRWVSDGIHG